MQTPFRSMWRHWIAFVAAAIGPSILARSEAAPVAAPLSSAALQPLMREGEVPGLAAAVIVRGSLRQVSALGVKNVSTGEPVDNRTVFEAASLSKPVVAYAVLKLVDAGKLRLDGAIADYVDGGVLGGDPRWKRITIRMLLSHSSGLPNELFPGQTLKIDFEPGSRFSYSGVGYSFLQSAIEKVTGEGFETVVARSVFQPLGMKDSSFVWQPTYAVQKAFGHNSVGQPTGRRKPEAAKAPSSLHTSARDYGRFLQAVLNRTGLSSSSWQAMTSVQTSVASNCVVCFGKPASIPHPALAWGLGWAIERSPGKNLIFHWGENNGDFNAFVMGDPDTRTGLVVLTNSGNGMTIVPAVAAAVFPQPHAAFAWMGYDRYDSPARVLQRRILQVGAERGLAEIEGRAESVLTEAQWNRIGYQLLDRARPDDAIRLFTFNVRRFPNSANAYDSLGEAYLRVGNKTAALKHYQRSLELDPGNDNARQAIAKLKAELGN